MDIRKAIPDITNEEIELVNQIENTRERINDAKEYGDDVDYLYEKMSNLKEQLEKARSKRREES